MNESATRKTSKKRHSRHAPKLWYLIVKNLKSMFRDKAQMAWIIFYPLLFITIFAIAWGNSGSNIRYDIVIINNDITGVSNPETSMEANASLIFYDVLRSPNMSDSLTIKGYNNMTYSEAYEALRYERVDAIIIIDITFSECIYGIPPYQTIKPFVNITTIADEMTQSVLNSIVSQIVNQISMEVNGVKILNLTSTQVIDSVELTGFDLMAPGFIIAGVMVCISQLASHFAEEKEKRTMERLATTPVSRRDILLSGMISQMIVAMFQIFLMIFISTQLFGSYVHPETNLFLVFLIPFLFIFSALGIGLIIASIVKSENSAGSISWMIIIPLQFLGGIFIYGQTLPGQELNPANYAVHALRVVMINGAVTWDAIGVDIIFLISFGAIFTIIGIILFQRKSAINK